MLVFFDMISLQDWPSNAQDYQDGSGHWSDGTWGDDSWTSGWAKDQEYYGWKGDDQQGHNKYGSWAADWQQDDGILTQEVKCENVVNSDSGTQEDDPVTLQNDKAEPDEQWFETDMDGEVAGHAPHGSQGLEAHDSDAGVEAPSSSSAGEPFTGNPPPGWKWWHGELVKMTKEENQMLKEHLHPDDSKKWKSGWQNRCVHLLALYNMNRKDELDRVAHLFSGHHAVLKVLHRG